MELDAFRKWFDETFLHFVDTRIRSYAQFTDRSPIVLALDQVYQLAQHGKRIRPYLTYLGYTAEGGKDVETIKHALIAVELFHVFCLVHDDIIDEDDLRRGVTTVNALSRTHYEQLGRPQLAVRAGNAQALLIGDLIFAWVFELISTYAQNKELMHEFSHTIDEVVIGQMIDVDLMAQPEASRELILEKMRLKTAGYTFVQPLRMGRLLAGKQGHDTRIDSLGLSLGLAFQMQDDLLDIYGSQSDLGKQVGSDIEESQHTLLTQYVVDKGSLDDVQELHVLMGHAVNDERLQLLRRLFERTGATSSLKDEIQEHIQGAHALARELPWPADQKKALTELITYVEKRNT